MEDVARGNNSQEDDVQADNIVNLPMNIVFYSSCVGRVI
jgi:hypothetical protein